MSDKTLHENENYKVFVCYSSYATDAKMHASCYQVCNIKTGVVEMYTTSLPHAIHEAEHMNQALVSKSWEWITKKNKEVPVPAMTPFELQ